MACQKPLAPTHPHCPLLLLRRAFAQNKYLTEEARVITAELLQKGDDVQGNELTFYLTTSVSACGPKKKKKTRNALLTQLYMYKAITQSAANWETT